MKLTKNTIKKIPIEFRIKEIKANLKVFIFEKLNKLMPISSGSGEAIIKAPIKGSVQLKYFEWNSFLR